jgi:hypothetical protein
MKNLVVFILALMLIPLFGVSQSCLPEGIEFETQAQIDSFQVNHPGCTEIEGDVLIQGDNITNLNGLNVLTSIGGDLGVSQNWSLYSLAGLDNVTSVGGNLVFYENLALTSLTGLDNMTSIGGNLWCFISALTSLAGLDNVTSIGGYLGITNNPALTSLTGLDNVTSIGSFLVISQNNALTSLTGLDNIDATSIDSLFIYDNTSLSDCDVQSICDYLVAPNGTIEIHDNAPGCNSPEEVDSACIYVSVRELSTEIQGEVYPNPILTSAVLEYELKEPAIVTLTVSNHLGQQIETLVNSHQQQGKHQAVWNAEGLPPGIYFYRLQAGEQSASGKMIIVK